MGKKNGVTMDVGNDGVAVITISNPPVNSFDLSVINGMKEKFQEAHERNDVKAIVLTGKDGRFSGGVDINVFQQLQNTGDLSLIAEGSFYLVCNLVEGSTKPTVAAVEGLALGGGLELAMACHARVATPKAQLGEPELKFGVLPGCQRLPRLIGLAKAIDMMLLSKTISSEEGEKLGLIDALVQPGDLLSISAKLALDIAAGRKPFLRSLQRTDKIGSLSEARAVLKNSRQLAKKIAPNMHHYHACIDMIEEGIIHGGHHGDMKETEAFKKFVLSDTSKALVHVFFAQRATSKVPNVTDIGLKPRRVKKVGVIGGGLMGSGIATALLLSNIRVVLKEINYEYLHKGTQSVEANLKGLVSKGKLTQEKAGNALSLLKGVLDYAEFKDVDMVIEAVVENIELKQKIFREIEEVCPPHCIFASNTSTIDIDVIGEKTNSKDRIVGAHFFSPPHLMNLLEIVRSENTSAQVIVDLIALGKAIKKVPVVVGNCIGFAVNRTFFPYKQAAHMLVNLGVDLFRIDTVITSFGFPLGPFQLGDLDGHGTGIAAEKIYDKAYEESWKLKPISVTDEEILEMIMFPMINEACRVLDEGVVIRASDLDIASVLAMSFPSYRGGVVFWADTVGAKYIYEKLKGLSETYGSFFEPSRYLEERAMKGMLLSEPKSMWSRL